MIRAIVTDIEGTTSDIRFVHNILFPYARQHLPDFVRDNAQQPEVAAALQSAREEAGQPQADLDGVTDILLGVTDQDRKSILLKALQGRTWRVGHVNGRITRHP